jgi:hypothetical protein
MKLHFPRGLAALAVFLGAAATPLAAAPTTSTAVADGKGTVNVHILYFAEDSCVRLLSATEGAPKSIEAPKRTLVITVVLARDGANCVQKLRTLEHDIALPDRKGVKSVDIFYVDQTGRFIRSARPPIDRPGEDGDELE